jgi:hypothetical protein
MNLQIAIDLLEDIIKDAEDIFKSFPKQKYSKSDVLTLGIFFTLFDTTNDILILAKNKRFLSIPSLVRNFMDAYVDLLLISKLPNYKDSLLYKDCDSETKRLEAKLKKENISLFNYTELDLADFRERLKVLGDELKLLKRNPLSKKMLGVKDRYTAADLLWFYETAYSELCSHTHNSISAIEQRHITEVDSNNVILKYHQEYDYKDYNRYFINVVSYLPIALKIVDELLELNQALPLQNIQNKVINILNQETSKTS